jgi:hypothetical protein
MIVKPCLDILPIAKAVDQCNSIACRPWYSTQEGGEKKVAKRKVLVHDPLDP